MTHATFPLLQIDEGVQALNLEPLAYALTQSPHAVMDADAYAHAQTLYRQFLTIKKIHPIPLLIPQPEALAVWQAHILMTRRYRQDCHQLFGHFIEYFPITGVNLREELGEYSVAQRMYSSLHRDYFIEPEVMLTPRRLVLY